MNKKIFLTCLIILFAISFVAMLRLSQNAETTIVLTNTTTNQTSILTVPVVTTQQNTTLLPSKANELNLHATPSDCWIVYQQKIYDITSYLPRHPGGEQKIAPFCGKPGFEEAFLTKHGTSKVNTLMKVGVFIGDFDIKGVIV